MKKWIQFGKQVNRLVYALACEKYDGGIGSATRLVAEHINYAEISVRKMRRGLFRPQDDYFFEPMLELGKKEAGMGYEWAEKLLQSGRHPSPKKILNKIYGEKPKASVSVITQTTSPLFFFMARSTAAFTGAILLLGVWVYFFSPKYPPPHEPGLLTEMLWGLFVGVGLAFGVGGFDLYRAGRKFVKLAFFSPYLLLPLGGLLGAVFWHFGSSFFNGGKNVQSGALETFLFGLSYAAGLIMTIVGFVAYRQKTALERFQWLTFAGMVLLGGLIALLGFLLPSSHPAFSNQCDIDLFVGLILRLGMAIIAGLSFPLLNLPIFNNLNKFQWLRVNSLFAK
jgi:hypothetical protein